MKIAWKKVVTGIRIGLGIAIKLQDAHIIKVKGLDRVKTIKEIVDATIPEKPKPNGQGA